MAATLVEPPAREAGSDVMLPRPVRVSEVIQETHDTCTLRVVSPRGEPLPAFLPGQFSMLYAMGVAELPISISGDPAIRDTHTYTIRSVGLATQRFNAMRVGNPIGIRGPFGNPWPMEEARGKDVLVVAGGIGLAPLRPILYHVFHHRQDFGRLILLYGTRSPSDLLFRKELKRWEKQKDTLVMTTVDYGGMSWKGNVGLVTRLIGRIRLNPARTIAMTCGPEIMMRYVAYELQDHKGLDASHIHLTMERNMKCGCGFCGHCQYGPHFICKDGPVFRFRDIQPLMMQYEI
ncbi:MAG: FAD/NAD(P)-binding protein [Bryobacterales bacterium]|jgi:NAD(P)H-flavin reductase|nr:FAD/NAD(P)-binding protein [Bryobacterales bacterium]